MTCQNCGHTPAAHIWKDDPERSDCGQSCDCTAYREPEPAVIEDARIRSVHIVPEGEGTGHIEPAVTDLPDAETAWRKWDLRHAEGVGKKDAFLAGFAAASEGGRQALTATDLPDAETAWVTFNTRNGGMTRYADNSNERDVFDAGFAAASGPWAEHLDAANERPRDRDSRGRWIFGKGPACRFIAATAWPFEAKENRDSWAPRIGDEPEFGEKELAAAYRRLDEAAESVGLTPALAAALARNAELEAEHRGLRQQIEKTAGREKRQVEFSRELHAQRDALQARLAAVTALCDEQGSAFPYVQVRELRAAVQRETLAQIDSNGGIADLFTECDKWRKTAESLQAELDSLRDRVNALGQTLDRFDNGGADFPQLFDAVRAIVRGSDDE